MNFFALKQTVNNAKESFEAYISDKTIPLNVRWRLFLDAPEYLKNDFGSMSIELDDYFGINVLMYEGDFHAERYARYETFEVVGILEEYDHYNTTAIKEKILAANFGFFTYDW